MGTKAKYKSKERKRFKEIFGFDAPISKISPVTGKFHIDLFELERKIPDYNSEECEYKGKENYSVSMAIKDHYGKEAVELIKLLI